MVKINKNRGNGVKRGTNGRRGVENGRRNVRKGKRLWREEKGERQKTNERKTEMQWEKKTK